MLRFRLRTLLIVVAVLAVPCAWVGYSLRWMEERHAAIEKKLVVKDEEWGERVTAPSLLWLFGEEGFDCLVCQSELPDDVDKATRLFPEAKVWVRVSGPSLDSPRPEDFEPRLKALHAL
jgi:hypothetical protein